MKADFPGLIYCLDLDSQSSLEGKIYIDGVLAATGAWQNQSYSYNSLYLGAHKYAGWEEHLTGWLDEVRVSNVVRTATEISDHYSNGLEFSPDSNTLGLWHMNELFGTTFANEVSGNGDLINGPSFVASGNPGFGNAVYFDGSDDRGDCNINIPEYSVTIEYWVKLDGMQVATFIQPYGSYSSRSGVVVDTIITNPTYIWSTGDTTACVTVSPNQTSTYWVTQNQNGVSCSDSVDITVLPQINIAATVNNNSSQNACNGAIFPNVSGGSPLYTFNWDTAGTFFANSQNIFNLCENTYCLTVTDNNGCTADTCFNVEWNPCNLNLSADSIVCNGDSTSLSVKADSTAFGVGPEPYFPGPRFVYRLYSLNPTAIINTLFSQSDSAIFPNISAGDYLVTVYDNSWQDSCFSSITISEPDPILIYTSIDSTSATWNNDGSILIDSLTGGIGGISITWYDSSYTQSFPGTPILFDSLFLDSIYYSHEFYGGYSITVTDSLGCPRSPFTNCLTQLWQILILFMLFKMNPVGVLMMVSYTLS